MAQSKILIVGGGSKFGMLLALEAKQYGDEVHIVTGTEDAVADRVIHVDWNHVSTGDVMPKIDKDYDVVLFNQNGGGSPNDIVQENVQLEHWNRAFFNNVQLPYYIAQHIEVKENAKIVWMLSPVFHPRLRSDEFMFGGYAADKAYSYHMMKSFATQKSKNYYGLAPKHFGNGITMYETIMNLTPDRSGKMLNEHGELWS
tara:strand:+ start:427 stop:1026 length:600 start_codon:yes stop_codon:yes gene_type:complete